MKEVIGFAFEAAWTAHDGFAAELAEAVGGALVTGGGLVGHVVMDVSGDEEVEAAVAVVVSPCGSGGPVAQGYAGFFGDVGEGAVVVVVVETVLAEVGDVDVGPAVVVVVGDGYAYAPAVVGDSSFIGDVGEGAVVIVVEESGFGSGSFASLGFEGGTVDEVNVEPAVVVVVDEAHAGAIGFDDEMLFGSAHGVLPGGEAGFFCDVLEDDGAGFDEAAGGDGAVLLIEDGGVDATSVDSAGGRGLAAFLGLVGLRGLRHQRGRCRDDRAEDECGESQATGAAKNGHEQVLLGVRAAVNRLERGSTSVPTIQ